METITLNKYDRIMSWALPAIAGLTPLVIVYALIRPSVAQSFFFQAAALGATASLGLAWLAGWRPLPGRPSALACLLLLNGVALAGSLICILSQQGGAPADSLSAWQIALASFKSAMLPIGGFLFFMSLVFFPRRRALLERINLVLIVLGGLLALYGVAQHFGYDFLNYSEQVQKNRVIATIGHPNYLASVLGPIAFLTLGHVFSRRRPLARIAGVLLIFLILFCITLARTRGVWLGIVLGLVAVIVAGTRYSIRRRMGLRWTGRFLLGSALALGALLALVFLVLPQFHAGIDMKERLTSEKQIKSRVFYWRAAVEMARAHPIFGIGYARFDPGFWDYVLEQQKSPLGPYFYDLIPAVSGRTPGHVHNEYLEVFAEQGYAGLTGLLALLVFLLYFGWRALMREADPGRALQGVAIYGALIAILVDAAFGFPWRLPVSLMVFMVILAWFHTLIYPETGEARGRQQVANSK